ncbi:MAG: AraC family transcriptional regulator, partial [Longimicrobiales bacterium]
MIAARCNDPLLRRALRAAASVEEDVVTEPELIAEALQWRLARLYVRDDGFVTSERPARIPVLDLDDATLRRWESERRSAEVPVAKIDFLTRRLRALVEPSAADANWVDAALADLSRAAGARLPLPLRAFARRVMEFPTHYTSLHQVARSCGLSRGALKARFRRRGLASPYDYLRWFRLMAVAEMLSDRSTTVSAAAHRLGFTSAGNLCRAMAALAQLTPTEVRTLHGWNKLLLTFAWNHLTPEALDAWADLDQLFQRRAA